MADEAGRVVRGDSFGVSKKSGGGGISSIHLRSSIIQTLV